MQTCPKRNNQYGPWERGVMMDTWETGRWSKNLLLVRALRLLRKWINICKNHGKQTYFEGDHNDEWLWRGPVPRTCSFCGSIHPDDAVRLLRDGWGVEGTGKAYKRYLNPPGYEEYMSEWRKQLDVPLHERKRIDWWSPVPPVKLYAEHFVGYDLRAKYPFVVPETGG
jgi:hypothetical protein